jgi:hypothetical protein
MDVPTLRVEVTRVREAASAVEVAHVAVVLAVETSAQEAAITWDSTAAQVKDAGDQAALTEREARERMSRVEAESTVGLASAHEETKGLVWKIVLLEGELTEVCWAHKMAEKTARGLSDVATDAEC